MSTSDIQVQWVTKESQAQAFAVHAREGGATVLQTKRWVPGVEALDDYGDAMFEPLTAVGLIIAVGWLVRRIADVLDDVMNPGGYLIDIREQPAIVRPLPKSKPPGKLVIVSTQGAQVFPAERRDEGLAFLMTLLGPSHGK